MSNLVALIKNRVTGLNMKAFHIITDYMLDRKCITEADIPLIYDEIDRISNTSGKHSIIFEIAANQLGYIDEEELKDIITKFRGAEVVSPVELENMELVFDTFSLDLCQKHKFFEYKDADTSKPDSHIKQIIVSFTTADKINILLKRNVSEYRVRYTLPSYFEPLFHKASKIDI